MMINNKTETRGLILNTAAVLFRNKGYHATGLNEIIRESGAPKGCLYYHFPQGKEQLAQEAIKVVGLEIQAKMEKVFQVYDEPVEAIQEFIRQSTESIFTRAEDRRFSVSLLALETMNMNENLRQTCSEVFADWEEVVYNKLCSGGFSPERARSCSEMVIAMIEGAMTLSLTKRQPEALLSFADWAGRLLRQQ